MIAATERSAEIGTLDLFNGNDESKSWSTCINDSEVSYEPNYFNLNVFDAPARPEFA